MPEAPLDHAVQVAVVGIVVVVGVAAEAELVGEVLAQRLDARRRLAQRIEPPLQRQREAIDARLQLGHRQVGIGILRDRQRRFEQRQRFVAAHRGRASIRASRSCSGVPGDWRRS
ncbi:MAG: hypothetical protein M5U30_03310 [Burkholderiaceae bacterium]|nr:hypothetical protein [Burkholderiaceae bacterium]